METIEPALSFVVPLYNTGESLPALLDSFRAASIPEPWELVLVDDGSADGTMDRARALTAEFPAAVTLVIWRGTTVNMRRCWRPTVMRAGGLW